MQSIAENLEIVREKIARAAGKAGRDAESVKLVAVSKTHPPELIRSAYEAGQRAFGENYAQEFRDKAGKLPDDIEWHFIGSLQRNKVKMVVDKVAVIQSLDKISLAQEIEKRAQRTVAALIEVNIAGEDSKGGTEAAEAEKFIEAVLEMKNIDVRGLMTMPPLFDDPERARPYFVKLRELRDLLEKRTGAKLTELSMGMSSDYEAAVEEGATKVRVGTAIFGQRHY